MKLLPIILMLFYVVGCSAVNEPDTSDMSNRTSTSYERGFMNGKRSAYRHLAYEARDREIRKHLNGGLMESTLRFVMTSDTTICTDSMIIITSTVVAEVSIDTVCIEFNYCDEEK